MSNATGDSVTRSEAGFLVNVNLVFVSTVLGYGLGFLVVVLVSRTLGDEGRGVTALYQSAVNVGFALVGLGMPTAAVYFVSRRDLTPAQMLENSLSITIAAAGVTAVVVLLLWLLAGDRLSAEGLPYWMAIVALPAVLQLHVIEAVLRAQGRFGAANVINILILVSLLLTLMAIELIVGLTISRTIYAWSLTFLIPIALGYAVLGPANWPRRFAPRSRLVQAVRFGAQGQLGNFIQLLNYRLDAYLVLLFVSASGVGVYANGVALSEGMWFIANSVAVVLLTNLTAGDEAYAARMTPLVCRNTLLVTALACIGIAALAPVVVPIVFSDAVVLPFLLLLPGTVALSGTKILAAYVFSRGRPMINALVSFATLVVTVIAGLVLIPIFEVPGAAAAASIGYFASFLLTTIAYRQMSGASIAAALVPRPSDASLYVGAFRGAIARIRPAGSSS